MTVSSEAEEQEPLLRNRDGDRDERRRGSYRTMSVEIEMQENASKSTTAERNGLTYSWRDVRVRSVEPTKREFPWGRWFSRAESPPATGKLILERATGTARPGELTVIMGASGAGKTTLLNALTFRTKANAVATGDRFVNGRRVGRETMTSISAYVQQDDAFLGCLTVREHLVFHAMVRMDESLSRRQRIARVDDVIDELGLRKCENTAIRAYESGISGGERKRLSFASEILTDPPIMFCDEPTSGLDSVMALNVVSVLGDLARRKGKTVVCTIHQPSSEMYSAFDEIILLAEGRTAFQGTRDEASAFFRELGVPCPLTYNPADFYMQLLAVIPHEEESCRETIAAICESFETSPAGLRLANDVGTGCDVQAGDADLLGESSWHVRESSPYKASWTSQFRAVIWRSWLCIIKDPILVRTRLFQNVVVSVLMGILYFQQRMDEDAVFNINGVLFVYLTNMTFQNVFAVIAVFCSEQPVFLREHLGGMYRVDVYFLCKTLAELPVFVALPVVSVAITYYAIGLNAGVQHFVTAMFVVVLVANVATSFGYFISSVSSNITMALTIGPPVIIPFLLFGGFLLNTRSIPGYFEWLSYLSWFRYGNEALLINQWSDIDGIECKTANATCPRNGRLVLEMYNVRRENFALDLLSLLSLILLFRVLAFLALLCKSMRK